MFTEYSIALPARSSGVSNLIFVVLIYIFQSARFRYSRNHPKSVGHYALKLPNDNTASVANDPIQDWRTAQEFCYQHMHCKNAMHFAVLLYRCRGSDSYLSAVDY